MTGLEKIIKGIADEAAAEAAAIKARAEAEAEAATAEILKEAAAKAAEIEKQARLSAEDILRAGESSRALTRRQRILAEKQALLEATLQKALEQLESLPDGEYFSLLTKLAAKNAEQGAGELLLSERDKARLPAGFEAALAAALPAGAKLSIGAATRPIGGGFVLRYGDIEMNCSFNAIFDERREEFSDTISAILFS